MQASALVSFPYDTTLVAIRRTHAPRAYWLSADKAWRMANGEATAFLGAADASLKASGSAVTALVDGEPRRRGVPEPVKAAPKTVAGHQVLPAPRNAKEARARRHEVKAA
jgi:hypothetical protein